MVIDNRNVHNLLSSVYVISIPINSRQDMLFLRIWGFSYVWSCFADEDGPKSYDLKLIVESYDSET